MSKIREMLAASGIDVDAEEEPDTLGTGEEETTALDGDELPEELGADEGDVLPGESESSQGPDAEGDDEAEQEATLPEGETTVAELRDALSEAWATIESLRNQIALIGGDAESDAFNPAAEPDVGDEIDTDDDDEYDAQADIDEQHRKIAELES